MKVTNFLAKLLVFFAVAGIVFILTLINTKLLLYLNWYKIGHGLDNYFAIISGIAYALGSISVVIWYNPKLKENADEKTKKQFKWNSAGATLLKSAFVILDGIHVYIYQNINYSDNIIPEVASIVFAIQTILILYFIGSVVDGIIKNPTKKTDYSTLETDYKNIKSKFVKTESDYNLLKPNYEKLNELNDELKSKFHDMVTENKNYLSQILEFKSEIVEKNKIHENRKQSIKEFQDEIDSKDEHILFLEGYFYKSERSRILKKLESNRTEKEKEILKSSEDFL